MVRIENDNKEALSLISAKLQKNYDKLLKKLSKTNIPEDKEKIADALTLGNDKNDRVIFGSLVASGLPVAYGLGKALVGLVSLVPSLSQPPSEEAVQFFQEAKDFSQNMLNSGGETIQKGLPLLLIPVGVTAVSISVKLYRNMIEKRENEAKYDNAIVNMIDDILDNKDDPNLEFAKKFFKRVDLSKNSKEANINILKYLAYYRYMLEQKASFKIDQDAVDEVYEQMVTYFKNLTETDKVSEEFKKSRFLNILIFDNDEKINKEIILGERPMR